MAIQDIGMFLPAESNYKTPGAYDEALRAEASKRAQYLSLMDQFYEQLNESQRQFNEKLSYEKWYAGEQLSISREQFSEDLALRTKIFEAESEYKQESLDVERMKINAMRPKEYLGTSPAEKSMTMAMDMVKQLTGASSRGTQVSTYSGTTTAPQSGQVPLTSDYTDEEKESMSWL
jgi:hypothetical protein